jgi:uncharacterized membrane protein YcaP (DUF421 family)
MEKLLEIDVVELLVPTRSLAEIAVRGTVMYLALVVILRFVMKRRTGSLSIADLLVIVVLADAAQNAFSSDYRSLTEGVLLVMTIVFWDYALDRLSYKYPAVRHFLHSPPLLLVRKGKLVRQNLGKEALTDQELLSHLRQQGVESLNEVKSAYLEDDGQISVIREPQSNGRQTAKKKPKAGEAP